LGVVAREEKESGEVWFYVPAQVKNLAFKCAEYTAPPLIPAVMKGGVVYRITLNPDAIYETVTNAVLSATYLKLRVNEPNSFLSLGKTKKYELINQNIDNQDFAELLDYGTYYVRVEHPLYETYEGVIVLDNTTPEQSINLTPAYDYLQVKSSPSGATVYIDNKRGKTGAFRRNTVIFGKPVSHDELGYTTGGRVEYMNAAKYVFRRICEIKYGPSDTWETDPFVPEIVKRKEKSAEDKTDGEKA
jgi:hypothetical protein